MIVYACQDVYRGIYIMRAHSDHHDAHSLRILRCPATRTASHSFCVNTENLIATPGYRCPGSPGGRNRLSPRFSTTENLTAAMISTHFCTHQRCKKYTVSSSLVISTHFCTLCQKVKNLYTRYYIISPVEEIDTPLAEIFNYITEYLTGP